MTSRGAAGSSVGVWYSVKWKPAKKRTYRYYVCAKNAAGLRQSKIGSAKVVVRRLSGEAAPAGGRLPSGGEGRSIPGASGHDRENHGHVLRHRRDQRRGR